MHARRFRKQRRHPMIAPPIRDSRELGLVLTQQLLAVEHLHYGLWTDDLPVCLANLGRAQQAFNALLLDTLATDPDTRRVLDVGCGVGSLLLAMRQRGLDAEGLSPSIHLNEHTRRRLTLAGCDASRVHDLRFEELDPARCGRFDAVVFSESFQYVSMQRAIGLLPQLLRPGGRAIICDFFRTDADGDGGPGDGAFGGGHRWREFAPALAGSALHIEHDRDITPQITPNLVLLEEVLQQRIAPAIATVDGYLSQRRPLLRWLIRRALRRQIERVRFKYLSGHRGPTSFARYKTYRLVVLRAA